MVAIIYNCAISGWDKTLSKFLNQLTNDGKEKMHLLIVFTKFTKMGI